MAKPTLTEKLAVYAEEIVNLDIENKKLKKQLQQATGCLALYLEAEDMLAKQSCDKGTVEFLRSLG